MSGVYAHIKTESGTGRTLEEARIQRHATGKISVELNAGHVRARCELDAKGSGVLQLVAESADGSDAVVLVSFEIRPDGRQDVRVAATNGVVIAEESSP